MKFFCRHICGVIVVALALLGAPRAALAACTSPDGIGGTITWNGTDSVIWCDGTNWYALKNAAGASGSAGYIQFSNGSGGFSNSGTTAGQQLFWDDTNKRLGIGTTTPSSTLYVKGNTLLSDDTANVTASYPLRVYSASNASGLVNLYYQNADVNGANLSLQKYKSGGNEIAAGDILGSIDFFGTTGAGNSLRAAQIRATAETGWGGTGDAPGRLTFWTTPDGSSTAVERMRIDNAGNVGIGTTSPSYKLHIAETRTDTSAGNFVMTRDDLNVNPGASSASTFIARMHRADIPSGNGFNITGAINSASNYTTHTGTGTVAVAYGSSSLVDNLSATGIITNATGANNAARGNSAGTITGAYGASNIAHTMNAATTMTSGYGAYNAAQTTLGTMTNGFGSYDAVLHNAPTTMAVARGSTSAISVGSGATVTTAYGVYTSLSNAGTVASWYGLYVPASTGTAPTTNRYPVYVVDTGSNYFAGNVGIGTSTPAFKLDVAGNAAFSGNVFMGRTTASASSTPAGLTIQHLYGVNYGLVLVSDNAGASSVVRFDNPNGNVGSIVVTGTTTTYTTSSDRRLKENITDATGVLERAMRIPVRNFSFKSDPTHQIQTGFIAQEVAEEFPEAVVTNGDDGTSPLEGGAKAWSVDYGRLTPLLLKAVQELKAANDNLQATVEAQGAEIEALKAAIQQ